MSMEQLGLDGEEQKTNLAPLQDRMGNPMLLLLKKTQTQMKEAEAVWEAKVAAAQSETAEIKRVWLEQKYSSSQ